MTFALGLRCVCLVVAGVVHLLPLGGLSRARLPRLYGIAAPDDGLALLLCHRAVLFGLLGALLVTAAFVPGLVPVALAGGLASTIAFLVLAMPWRALGPKLRRVVVADAVAIAALVVALATTLASRGVE